MAMNAKQAAELINNGKFDNAAELYDALNGNKEYVKEFELLLQHIENKVKLDILHYVGLANSAEAVDALNDETNPLDEKNQEFADVRKKLSKLELYQTVEENGEKVIHPVEGKVRDDMIYQLVSAAKLETNSELRGANKEDSPEAKQFMNASSYEQRKEIYKNTLNEKIDLAILQSFLVSESQKINDEMSKKYGKDEKKALEEATILLSARTKEIKAQITNLSKNTAQKLSVSIEGAAAYCAQTAVKVEEQLSVYKEDIRKTARRINQGFAQLKDKSKALRNDWQKARSKANKIFESCSQKMYGQVVAFNTGCERVWNTTYTVAKKVAKNLADRKYEIGADMLAAAGFALTVTTGGTAAVVGGAAYAAYTIGRRVVYEAYKQKKENPKKSYKEIYTNGKFLTKAAFSCAAAAVSMGIASTAASLGADVATQTATEIAKQLAAQKASKRLVTLAGSITSNAVGVATAKNKDERKKEWKSLGFSALGGAAAMFVAEICGNANAGETPKDLVSSDHSMALENAQGYETYSNTSDRTFADDTSYVDDGWSDYMFKDFPDQWNDNMGISHRQFETLKDWYEKLDTTDGAGMDRFYSHAARYAEELSMDADNPMTAEQVLFKFSRLAAITSVRDGEYGTIGTGSLGKQLDNLYHLLGCNDQLTAEEMEEARRTLDICTLNEAGRADGRMDAAKFFAVAGSGYKGLPVDEDGTLTMTRNIRVIGEGTDCPKDTRVMYEDVAVQKEPVSAPKVEARIVQPEPKREIEQVSNLGDDQLQLARSNEVSGDIMTSLPQKEQEDSVIIGAVSQTGERPGIEGANAARNLTEDSECTRLSGRKQKLAKEMYNELVQEGRVRGRVRD